MKSKLVSISEAALLLGLKSKQSIYRKIHSGELTTYPGPKGTPYLALEGLEDQWKKVTRQRADSPRPGRPPREQGPVRPLDERLRQAVVIDQAPESVPRSGDEQIPDYNESRARSEFEKANLLELERRQKEGLLVPRKDVELTWAQVITTAKTKLLGVPSRAKQRIPHLTLEEIEIINVLMREALEELSGEGDDD